MRKAPGSKAAGRAARIRCAIYTRKSHEEGLEQDFNSLDAQRDACEAYITSQKHEGWTCLPEMYDDGGISGSTMDRPALRRLLADIVTAILRDRHPLEMTAKRLANEVRLPVAWEDQRTLLGIE